MNAEVRKFLVSALGFTIRSSRYPLFLSTTHKTREPKTSTTPGRGQRPQKPENNRKIKRTGERNLQAYAYTLLCTILTATVQGQNARSRGKPRRPPWTHSAGKTTNNASPIPTTTRRSSVYCVIVLLLVFFVSSVVVSPGGVVYDANNSQSSR